jgi:hypothetical protein
MQDMAVVVEDSLQTIDLRRRRPVEFVESTVDQDRLCGMADKVVRKGRLGER